MGRRLRYARPAERDLASIYAHIRDSNQDPIVAAGYLRRIRARCDSLVDFPEQGRHRPDLGRGIRTLGFERRVLIVFRSDAKWVEVVRVLYGGRSFGPVEP
ncbi:MAG TPA: type II toxin-antitoxin system RelE/ParE family toxin [Beijerinckiaceae bacterium]|nr:type II toxin-antitoxin system RelE/ParE family toxin [Beijerinckiaceae bacterium]